MSKKFAGASKDILEAWAKAKVAENGAWSKFQEAAEAWAKAKAAENGAWSKFQEAAEAWAKAKAAESKAFEPVANECRVIED